MIKTANFPTSVWDGKSESRQSLTDDHRPDAYDFDRLRTEVRALQTYLLTGGEIVTAPSGSDSTGRIGQRAYDATYYYICVATNTWIRVTRASFASEGG